VDVVRGRPPDPCLIDVIVRDGDSQAALCALCALCALAEIDDDRARPRASSPSSSFA
jgi:hypothetical protein